MSLLNLNANLNNSDFSGYYGSTSYYDAFMQAYNNYNNYNSIVFKRSNYKNNNAYNFSSTSSIAERAVQVAETELSKGVKETSNNDSIDIRRYKKGVANDNAWCASFVSYLYGDGQNLSNNNTFGYTTSSQEIKRRANEANCFAGKNSGYIPQRGDLAVWTNVGDPSHGHVGIVVQADKLGFWAIEGNSSNRVKKNYYSYASLGQRFSGWAQMSKWLGKSNRFEAIG